MITRRWLRPTYRRETRSLAGDYRGRRSLSNFNTLADDWTIEERSLAALHAWGLEHILLSQPMRTLSGGEKTKVFLSGIEIHQPSILLLDEPTNHLDSVAGEVIRFHHVLPHHLAGRQPRSYLIEPISFHSGIIRRGDHPLRG